MGRLIIAWFALLWFCNVCTAQTLRLEVQRSGAGRSYTLVSRYADGIVTNETEELYGDGSRNTERESAKLSDLDLGSVATLGRTGDGAFVAELPCKGQSQCVSDQSSLQGAQLFASINIDCDSANECWDFIKELKDIQAPKLDVNTTTRPQQVQPSGVQSRPPSGPQSIAEAPAASDLHDLLASIGWLSGNGSTPPGKSALDNLVQNIKPTQNPAPKPLQVQHPTFAAFSQAGGFDANGAWGVGTATDLNSAIGQAENTCHQGAQSVCDDMGYCMLQPGYWGAWASDLKVAGNTAFACNLQSEGAAQQQAQAWCGDGCKVLWSGAGQ